MNSERYDDLLADLNDKKFSGDICHYFKDKSYPSNHRKFIVLINEGTPEFGGKLKAFVSGLRYKTGKTSVLGVKLRCINKLCETVVDLSSDNEEFDYDPSDPTNPPPLLARGLARIVRNRKAAKHPVDLVNTDSEEEDHEDNSGGSIDL